MTVFFDIDTQNDFLLPAGALYVPGAEQILPAIARLNQSAPLVVSTMDAHCECEDEFHDWPPHCVAGCIGQQKPSVTLLPNRIVVGTKPGLPSISGAQQILLEKRKLDLFSNPNLPALLDRLNADEYVVYGVVTEYCVRFAALGLARTGKPVTLVTAAIRAIDESAAGLTMKEFGQLGGRCATVDEVCKPV
jgi:nicotinamidase/pyrazinamidase